MIGNFGNGDSRILFCQALRVWADGGAYSDFAPDLSYENQPFVYVELRHVEQDYILEIRTMDRTAEQDQPKQVTTEFEVLNGKFDWRGEGMLVRYAIQTLDERAKKLPALRGDTVLLPVEQRSEGSD